jgi:hypothetical protein
MTRKQAQKYLSFGLGGFLLAGLLSLLYAERWQGRFQQAEYRLRFTDREGNPIKGIQLLVFDSQGKESLYFPVSDHPIKNLETDKNGVIIFHHICTSNIEASGECHRLFWTIPIGDCSLPVFTCVFRLQNKNIFEMKFNKLNDIAIQRLFYSGDSSVKSKVSKVHFERRSLSNNQNNNTIYDNEIAEKDFDFDIIEIPITI